MSEFKKKIITMRDIRQLEERGVPALAHLSSAIGKSWEQTRRLVETGGLDNDPVAVEIFRRLMVRIELENACATIAVHMPFALETVVSTAEMLRSKNQNLSQAKLLSLTRKVCLAAASACLDPMIIASTSKSLRQK